MMGAVGGRVWEGGRVHLEDEGTKPVRLGCPLSGLCFEHGMFPKRILLDSFCRAHRCLPVFPSLTQALTDPG